MNKKRLLILLGIGALILLLVVGYRRGWFKRFGFPQGRQKVDCNTCLNRRMAEGLSYGDAMDTCIADGSCGRSSS